MKMQQNCEVFIQETNLKSISKCRPTPKLSGGVLAVRLSDGMGGGLEKSGYWLFSFALNNDIPVCFGKGR